MHKKSLSRNSTNVSYCAEVSGDKEKRTEDGFTAPPQPLESYVGGRLM